MLTRKKGGRRPTFYRAKKILALVPKHGISSDIDESSDSEPEIPSVVPRLDTNNYNNSDDDSSPAPSLPSSFENLHILSDDDIPELQDTHIQTLPMPSPLSPAAPTPSPLTPMVYSTSSPLTPIAPAASPLTSHTLRQIPSHIRNNFELPPPSVASSSTDVPSPNSMSTRSKRRPAGRNIPKRFQRGSLSQRSVRVPKKQLDFKWTNKKFLHCAEITEKELPVAGSVKTPLQYFETFLTEDIVDMIVSQTNLYSTQMTGKSINVTVNDIKDFIAMNLLMGIVKVPAYTDYWSKEYRYAPIADTMSLKRFQAIRRYIHFNDNLLDDGDRYYKIRPLVQMVRENFVKVDHETRFSVDEMMVPYKGKKAGNRKQYVKNKPKKWGFKIFVRAGVSGFIYDFAIYGGDDTFRFHNFTPVESNLGLGAKVVIALCKSIPEPACSVVYFDNFFTSLELICHLREEMGIFSLGTIRSNRLRGAEKKLPTDKALKKKPRGAHSQVGCNSNKVCVVKWFDNKCVTTASSFVDANPISSIMRYDKNVKQRSPVPCPEIIKQYNAHMGGVDLADMLIALNRTELKGHRWYLPIVSQILDMCLVNSWLLYRRDNKNTATRLLNLKKFRYNIVQGMIKCGRPFSATTNGIAGPTPSKIIKAPVVPRPTADVRLDKYDHFPLFGSKMRCKLCKKGQTTVRCSKCMLNLCLTPSRNCFVTFHTM